MAKVDSPIRSSLAREWSAWPSDPIREVEAAVRSVLAGKGRGGEVFAGRLLALRHAESLPGGTREVGIAPGTVVTPLARDFLKRNGIALRFVARDEVETKRARGEWGFAVEVESGTVAAWRRALLEEGWSEVGSAERWVIEGPSRGALLVTDEASAAVWRACQVSGVRATSAVDPDSVARAVRHLGANLLVIEPAGKSIPFLKQMGLTFRRAGAPQVPSWMTSTREGPTCGSPR